MTEFRSVVSRFAERAAANPDAQAVVQGSRMLTYGELWRDVCAVAGFFQARGVRPGDRVAVLLENSPEYIAAYYGALAAGAVAVGLNASARTRELACWIDHCEAAWLVADARHPDFAELAARQRGTQLITVG